LKLEAVPGYSFWEQLSNILDFFKSGKFRVTYIDSADSTCSQPPYSVSPFLVRIGSFIFGTMEYSRDGVDERLLCCTVWSKPARLTDRDVELGSTTPSSLENVDVGYLYPHSKFSFPEDSDESDISEHRRVGEDEDHSLIRSRR
jgi:hypothetical protein